MKVLEKENITQKEYINYFKKNKYLLDKSFDERVKAEFFEMSAIPNPHYFPIIEKYSNNFNKN